MISKAEVMQLCHQKMYFYRGLDWPRSKKLRYCLTEAWDFFKEKDRLEKYESGVLKMEPVIVRDDFYYRSVATDGMLRED